MAVSDFGVSGETLWQQKIFSIWQVAEESAVYGADNEHYPQGCPITEE